jgi:predicted metal-binding protein
MISTKGALQNGQNKANGVFWYIYRSLSSGNIYPLEMGSLLCQVKDLVYEPEKVWAACVKGCSNYGTAGGCPPRSPKLRDVTSLENPVWLIYCRFWSKFKHEKVLASHNTAIHWKFQDAILARLLANIGYKLAPILNGSFLSTGYCMGCVGKKCNFKLGLDICRNPQKRTFSMEATGINVVETVKKLFDIDLYWYSKGNTDVPYMLKCIAVFPEKVIEKNRFLPLLITTVNDFPSCLWQYNSDEYWSYIQENLSH